MNPGGQYSNVTGEYTCEKSGLYYFTYTVFGYRIEDGASHAKVSVTLMKQGMRQGAVWVSNNNIEGMYITLSQSLVLQCHAGEKVWVQSRGNNNYINGYSERNLFAGVLMIMN